MDLMADETGRLGLSVHGLRGSAEMASVGEVEMSASGVGVHATTFIAGGFHVDAQAAMTWYDVDLKSAVRGVLKDGVKGREKRGRAAPRALLPLGTDDRRETSTLLPP